MTIKITPQLLKKSLRTLKYMVNNDIRALKKHDVFALHQIILLAFSDILTFLNSFTGRSLSDRDCVKMVCMFDAMKKYYDKKDRPVTSGILKLDHFKIECRKDVPKSIAQKLTQVIEKLQIFYQNTKEENINLSELVQIISIRENPKQLDNPPSLNSHSMFKPDQDKHIDQSNTQTTVAKLNL